MPDRDANQPPGRDPNLPDPSSHGGHPYTPTEIAMGYGTDNDPRFAMPERDANQLAADATETIDNLSRYAISTLRDALDQLVGLVGTLQQERDEARAAHSVWFDLAAERLRERVAAEAALATTRQALERYAQESPTHEMRAVARLILADTGGDKEPA